MKKLPEAKKEALEIVELAIDDLTNLAKTFNLMAELGNRGYSFDDCEEQIESHEYLH